MSIIHHPAFQSIGLPLLLALMATGLLGLGGQRRAAGWAGLGAGLALLASYGFMPGLEWPATARTQKLPWVVLAAVLLTFIGVGLEALRSRRWLGWSLGAVLWAAVSVWLSAGPFWALAGAVVLALLLLAPAARTERQPPDGAGVATAAALAVAAVGQAAMAALGGSLLLAQLALMVAVVTAVPAIWGWLRPDARVLVSPMALLPLGMAWMTVAHALALTVASGPLRLGLVALGLATPALLGRTGWAARHPRALPWLVAAVAAIPVALALLPLWGEALPGGAGEGAAESDDPYYQPAWD